jgi:hypothetical protein
MKRFQFLIAVIFIFGSVACAGAFTTPVTDKNQQAAIADLGNGFLPAAQRLGFPVLAWGNVLNDGALIVLEYLPDEKTSVEAWDRMVTITVYALSGEAEKDRQILTNIQSGLIKGYGDNGKILQSEFYTYGPEKYPMAFIEYKVGKGAQTEHNAGVLIKPGDKIAAFVQIQCRKWCKTLAPQDIANIKTLVGQETAKQ